MLGKDLNSDSQNPRKARCASVPVFLHHKLDPETGDPPETVCQLAWCVWPVSKMLCLRQWGMVPEAVF